MEDKANVKFRLVSIENERIISEFKDFDFSDFDEEKLRFQYKIETLVKISEDTILVTADAKYSYEGKELMTASATFNYSVLNLNSAIVLDKENQKLNTKADIFPSLVGAAYNTLRGIVYARTVGTQLSKYPMPMIEVSTLVKKNGIAVEE